jgi:hypothetical protein
MITPHKRLTKSRDGRFLSPSAAPSRPSAWLEGAPSPRCLSSGCLGRSRIVGPGPSHSLSSYRSMMVKE